MIKEIIYFIRIFKFAYSYYEYDFDKKNKNKKLKKYFKKEFKILKYFKN